jgi:hypothetical protein
MAGQSKVSPGEKGSSMKPRNPQPPEWAEQLLERLLPARNRQTITGDLREEYLEVILPSYGPLRAHFWYLRQLSSIASRSLVSHFFTSRSLAMHDVLRTPLLIASLWTCICGAWLATMESILQHPGYPTRIAIALGVALIGLATILARFLHLSARSERWLWIAAVALIALGGYAFVNNLLTSHFEGFVFLLSLSFILQGFLMLAALGWPRAGARPTPPPLAKTTAS